MKVQRINDNVYPQKNPTQFRGKGLDPDVVRHLNANSGKMAKFLHYVGENQGEALNILVTAFGTAIICPLFIAFNPFSKEDDKTKQYSAWRQPISAIIAVAAQLTITKWFNNWIAQKASTKDKDGNAHFLRADLRAKPHERYLTRIIKLEHPEWDKKRIEEEIKKRQLDAEKSEIHRYRQIMKDKHISIKELVCQDYIDKAEEKFFEEFKTNNKEEIEKKFGKSIDDIWSTKLKKHLNKMLDDKAASMGKDRQTLLQETAEKMVEKEVNAEAVAKSAIRYLKAKGANVDKAIETCNLEGVERIIKALNLDHKFTDGLDSKQVAEEIVKKLNHIKEWECEHKLKDFTSVKHMGNNYEEVLHNVKVKKLVRSRTSDARRVFKTKNTQLGLIVTLATLPFTCGFLNWAYPRIMEKIMPEMTAKKKEISQKIDEIVDSLGLDEIKDKVSIDQLKNALKLGLEKGEDD